MSKVKNERLRKDCDKLRDAYHEAFWRLQKECEHTYEKKHEYDREEYGGHSVYDVCTNCGKRVYIEHVPGKGLR